MQFLLEKLSNVWQLRAVAIVGGIVLIVYAVMMPVHGIETASASRATAGGVDAGSGSADDSRSVPAASVTGNSVSNPLSGAPDDLSGSLAGQPSNGTDTWAGDRQGAVRQLRFAAESYEEDELLRDFSDSIRAVRDAAERGDPAAQFLLGNAYELGRGVPKEMAATVRWFKAAAEANGEGRLRGGDAARDFPQALEVYRKAAEDGDSAAELYLGLRYDLGENLPRDPAQAAFWYRRAAAQGSSSAANNLGVLYQYGRGVPKDSTQAEGWFEKAAARGSGCAQYNLGRMYFNGEGVPRDGARAAALLRKAAEQGIAPAEVMLSLMYASGDGVKSDVARAYMWINLGAGSGPMARSSRDVVEKEISPVELAEGRKLTRDWLLQHTQVAR